VVKEFRQEAVSQGADFLQWKS